MRKVAFLRSAGRVAGLVALGLAPLLVAVSGLRLSAPDGTLIWEPPAIPEMTLSITVGQRPPPAGRQAENPQPARVGRHSERPSAAVPPGRPGRTLTVAL